MQADDSVRLQGLVADDMNSCACAVMDIAHKSWLDAVPPRYLIFQTFGDILRPSVGEWRPMML